MFSRVGSMRRGYNGAQVDSFLAEARQAYEGSAGVMDASQVMNMVFADERGGYKRREVDATLDRLVSAFVAKDRAEYVARNGQQAWFDKAADLAVTLYPRLLRPTNERFAEPVKASGYKKSDVDQFLDRVAAFFNDGAELNAEDVRSACFRSARSSKAYDERIVDAYLNRVLLVMLAVE